MDISLEYYRNLLDEVDNYINVLLADEKYDPPVSIHKHIKNIQDIIQRRLFDEEPTVDEEYICSICGQTMLGIDITLDHDEGEYICLSCYEQKYKSKHQESDQPKDFDILIYCAAAKTDKGTATGFSIDQKGSVDKPITQVRHCDPNTSLEEACYASIYEALSYVEVFGLGLKKEMQVWFVLENKEIVEAFTSPITVDSSREQTTLEYFSVNIRRREAILERAEFLEAQGYKFGHFFYTTGQQDEKLLRLQQMTSELIRG